LNNESIKFIRLTNGEDLIASVTDSGMNHMTIETPMKVIYTLTEQGNMAISLTQWVYTRLTESTFFPLSGKDVLSIADASASIIMYYRKTIEFYEEMNRKTQEFIESLEEDVNEIQEESESSESTTDPDLINFMNNLLNIKTNNKKKLH